MLGCQDNPQAATTDTPTTAPPTTAALTTPDYKYGFVQCAGDKP